MRGQAPDDPKHFQVFKYKSDLQAAGYHLVPGTAVVFGSWSDYLNVRRHPPDPGQIGEDGWYEYLDEVDEGARRHQRGREASSPPGGSRDEVAAWMAKQHFLADAAVREIWYLPGGARPDEIRLLELSDRMGGGETRAEPLDFGLDVEGARFRLSIADVTSDLLEQIKTDPSRLPPGWSLDKRQAWPRRRGA